MRKLLTPAEAGRRLGMTPSGVRWLADVGRLKSLRTVGGYRLFREMDVEDLRRQRKRHSPSKPVEG